MPGAGAGATVYLALWPAGATRADRSEPHRQAVEAGDKNEACSRAGSVGSAGMPRPGPQPAPGLTGYFIGLAVTRRHRWYAVAWIGLAAAAILHGLNDWGRVNGHPLWIVVVAIGGILFLGYTRAGSGGGPHAAADAMLPAFSRHGTPDGHPA